MNASVKLKDKVAVVTGSSKGIGAAIAERLAAEGASVVVNYRGSAGKAAEVVKRIEANGGKAIALPADIASARDVENLFAESKAKLGPVDILVNNAGSYHFRALPEIDEAHIDQQFDLNVKGLILASREASKQMSGRGGKIINISSTVGESPVAGGSVYSATKAAVNAITISLALELGAQGIRVNAIAPGLTETEGTLDIPHWEAFRDHAISRTALGRAGSPADISEVVAFLASEESNWITGQVIGVDGGLRV